MRLAVRSFFAALLVVAALLPSMAFARALQPGDTFPSVTLPAPEDSTHVSYLGISPEAKTFDVAALPAPFALVEVFNSYCVHCQHDAPLVKQLTEMVASQGLDEKLKLLSIAANNNEFEIKLFREKYGLTLPMLPDPEMEAANALGVTGTPTYFLVRLGKTPKVLYTKVGRIPDIDEFFATLREKTGI